MKDCRLAAATTFPKPERFWIDVPVDDPYHITQHFGGNTTGVEDFYTRFGLPAHEGVDLGGSKGDAIFNAFDGVVKALNIPGENGVAINHAYGKHVKITHHALDGDYETDYCHLQDVASHLKVGDKIEQGHLVGYMGNTGNVIHSAVSDGTHLHLMLRKAGATAAGEKQRLADGSWAVYPNDIVNPEPYFK